MSPAQWAALGLAFILFASMVAVCFWCLDTVRELAGALNRQHDDHEAALGLVRTMHARTDERLDHWSNRLEDLAAGLVDPVPAKKPAPARTLAAAKKAAPRPKRSTS
jgi:hypothetical protein